MGKGRKGRGEEVLGHLFWRKQAKSGHDGCMVNLLLIYLLVSGFSDATFLSFCDCLFFYPVCSVNETGKEKCGLLLKLENCLLCGIKNHFSIENRVITQKHKKHKVPQKLSQK